MVPFKARLQRSNLRSTVLAPLFPPATVVIERVIPGDPADLLPAERQYVVRARPKRLQEFAAGRACARAALAEFGLCDALIPVADDRQPVWPHGFTGSITHTAGFCAAVVARTTELAAVGLDSESVGAPTPDIWSTICRNDELAWIDTLPVQARAAAVTLVFSAKEAFYKCQYPLAGEWLDFHDLSIHAPAYEQPTGMHCSGEFSICAARAIHLEHLHWPIKGQYVFHDRFVSAGVALAAVQ